MQRFAELKFMGHCQYARNHAQPLPILNLCSSPMHSLLLPCSQIEDGNSLGKLRPLSKVTWTLSVWFWGVSGCTLNTVLAVKEGVQEATKLELVKRTLLWVGSGMSCPWSCWEEENGGSITQSLLIWPDSRQWGLSLPLRMVLWHGVMIITFLTISLLLLIRH